MNHSTTLPNDTKRRVARVVGDGRYHWVGDGFRVEGMFAPGDAVSSLLDPFLLLDYHAPYEYSPSEKPRGVGVHPHRGFETVTLAFDGSVAHHDSTGAGGVINPGDVQWMTAASGILHKEYHEAGWARRGGRFHMAQLWVNLPAAHKMDSPRYQALTADAIGSLPLGGGTGAVRVIAGEFDGHTGPARTCTPINLWDVHAGAPSALRLPIPSTHNAAMLVLDGTVTINGVDVPHGRLAILDHADGLRSGVELVAPSAARVLVMSGEPIGEPVAALGPFVMNSRQELIDAFDDFQAGRFGYLAD